MLNGLDLFSGIGGITLALAPWVRPVAYCENDRYCQGVLLSRMQSGDIGTAAIWSDVRTFNHETIRDIDIVYGGFPCQDISLAGHGAGLEGERSGLFWEIHRIVGELRPQFVFLENVAAITVRGGREIAGSFAALRYDCRWGLLSAYDVGAPHRRERWWLLAANTDGIRGWLQQIKKSECENSSDFINDGIAKFMANTNRTGLPGTGEKKSSIAGRNVESNGRGPWPTWSIEPDVDRVAYGVPARVDRIKGLGNAVVPAQSREAFRRLMGLDKSCP